MIEHSKFYKKLPCLIKAFTCILAIVTSSTLSAQFFDDFSRDLSSWYGQTERFTVNFEEQLQLKAQGFDQALIQRKLDSLPHKVWGGEVRLDFSPSNQNRLEIILIQLDSAGVQVRLEVGQTGSPDPLCLIYESRDTVVMVPTGMVFKEKVDFTYHIRADKNNWQYQITSPDTTVVDSTLHPRFPIENGEFKLSCHFTPSRSDLFFFDNLYAGTFKVDTLPPELDTLWIIDSLTFIMRFNEALAYPPNPDLILMSNGSDVHSTSLSNDSLSLIIELEKGLVSGHNYTLHIERTEDRSGNIGQISASFVYFNFQLADPYEILVTEIMADPSPALGLPECEYVEIFNRSSGYFRMSDYTLSDDSRQVFLPDEVLSPGEYAIVMDEDCCEVYDTAVKVWCLENVPAFNNDADVVEILDYVGRSIHRVPYERSWHSDGQEEGGWSLEMIDVQQPCFGKVNWTSADFETFGSPGRSNSVTNSLDIQGGPKIVEGKIDTSSVYLKMDRALTMSDLPKVVVEPDLRVIKIYQPNHESLFLQLDERPKEGTGYNLTLENVRDCLNEDHGQKTKTTLFLPRAITRGDLVINEVLYDPFSGGSDFVEIKNESEDHVKVDRVCLECRHPSDTSLTCVQVPIELAPGQVVAWTEDTSSLKSHYHTGHLLKNELIKLPDEGGQLILRAKIGTRLLSIDSMHFSNELHSPVLNDTEGYSLERIGPETSRAQGQWLSATSTSGGATPGLANSQTLPSWSTGPEVMSIPFSSFSPNGDGQRDFLPIDIQLPETGYVGRIDIFEQNGNPLGSILKEGLIGTSFSMAWSGRLDGTDLPPGFYILRGLFVHPDGERLVSKASCFLMP